MIMDTLMITLWISFKYVQEKDDFDAPSATNNRLFLQNA